MRFVRFLSPLITIFLAFGICALPDLGHCDSPQLRKARRHSPSLLRTQVSCRAKRVNRRPACCNQKDDDGDGKIDFPEDPGCASRKDKREADPPSNGGGGGGSGDVQLGEGASLGGKRAFPDTNPWNEDISTKAVDPNSDNLIASIGLNTGMHPDFGTVWEGRPIGIPYIVVPGSQAKVAVSFDYADESDSGPYPIPQNPPIEGGSDSDGDRHILMLDKDNWILYELYYAFKVNGLWHAGSGAIFDLNSNDLRPAGWTSADAAGLPIFPGLVRYDEVVEQGEIQHALRFTASRTRRGYVSPARHFASSVTDVNAPPMGMRVRLKQSVNISSYPSTVQVVLRALKKYGMFLADNGSNWFISGAPDARWNDDELSAIRGIKGRDFEVVEMGAVTTH